MKTTRALIIEPDHELRALLSSVMIEQGLEVLSCETIQQAPGIILQNETISYLVLDNPSDPEVRSLVYFCEQKSGFKPGIIDSLKATTSPEPAMVLI